MHFAELEHKTPCLAFALEETAHVNVWRNELDAMGLATGPWLQALKQAVHRGMPEDTPIPVTRVEGTPALLPLGVPRSRIPSLPPGQKLAHVTDIACTAATERAIVDLAWGADTLFIEAPFAAADVSIAARHAHLTTTQAGRLARLAGTRKLGPSHFSPRYDGEEKRLMQEVFAEFRRKEYRGCEDALRSPGTSEERQDQV